MKTTFSVRLPKELCGKIEREAKKSQLSINQYILYTLTKMISYDEAVEVLNSRLSSIPSLPVDEMLSRIPERRPLEGDELQKTDHIV